MDKTYFSVFHIPQKDDTVHDSLQFHTCNIEINKDKGPFTACEMSRTNVLQSHLHSIKHGAICLITVIV